MADPARELADRFRRWYDHEKDAHARVLESLHEVPPGRRDEAFFREAVDLFAHLVAARRLWLHRFGVADPGPSADELFPRGWSLETLEARLDSMQAEWTAYLESLDGDELTRTFRYRSFEGEGFTNRVEDLLAQLHGHSWYHRGQIASLLRRNGCEPAVTDYVFWSRVADTT